MLEIKIEENSNNLKIEFKQETASFGSQLILLILSVFCFIFALFLILTFRIQVISLGMLMMFSLVGYFFAKLFMWNRLGTEILEINEIEIIQTFDYVYFKETNKIENLNLELVEIPKNGQEIQNPFEDVLDLNSIRNEGVELKIKRNEPEFIKLNAILSTKDARKIIPKIKLKLVFK